MSKKLEGVYMGFLRQIMVNMAKRQWYGTCISVAAESVLKEVGTHTPGTYIEKWQATVAEWVVLRLIL